MEVVNEIIKLRSFLVSSLEGRLFDHYYSLERDNVLS
jgi:hypothetical protein